MTKLVKVRTLSSSAKTLLILTLLLSMLALPSNVPAQSPGTNVLYTLDADFDLGFQRVSRNGRATSGHCKS